MFHSTSTDGATYGKRGLSGNKIFIPPNFIKYGMKIFHYHPHFVKYGPVMLYQTKSNHIFHYHPHSLPLTTPTKRPLDYEEMVQRDVCYEVNPHELMSCLN